MTVWTWRKGDQMKSFILTDEPSPELSKTLARLEAIRHLGTDPVLIESRPATRGEAHRVRQPG